MKRNVDVTISQLAKSGLNQPEKVENFKDLAFGMFVHWSADCTIGSVISHWMIGCEEKLIDEFVERRARWFDPRYFCAKDLADLARQCGMKYLCFTAKHHNGFCMFDTKTTPFNIMNTAYKQDIVAMITRACRENGIIPGLYFSPLDFYWQYCKGRELHFKTPEMLPENNPDLMEYNKKQVAELLNNYGEIGMFFFDGPPVGLKELVWELQPGCVITRGEMETPEQEIPEQGFQEAWETCHTIGSSWGYKPYGDKLSSPLQIIEKLIEVRSKGGNFLLNIYPDPMGRIPEQIEGILREVGLYLFFNAEAIYNVRPYRIHREGNIFFTKAKDEPTVYAFITGRKWDFGIEYGPTDEDWKEIRFDVTIKSIHICDKTEVEIVGQSGKAVEHRPRADVKTRFYQDETGLHINALLAMRPQDDRQWPYPVVFRITHVM